ncbi:MAG: helix-turn-helix domain-containing protein [Lachnospiraceae bacterium]|nr:helix-turn-helix domain-containing protein [Lachnospiraceae bacterium]
MDFSQRIKQLRIKHNLTQGDLAKILGLKPTAISNYESKRNEPSIENLLVLANYFNISCDYLLGLSDAFLPVGGEVLDKEVVDFYELYRKLEPENVKKAISYIEYLAWDQDKKNKK